MLGCKDLHNSFFDGFVFGCTDVVAFTKRVTVMKVCLTAEFICCKEILLLPHTNERFDIVIHSLLQINSPPGLKT